MSAVDAIRIPMTQLLCFILAGALGCTLKSNTPAPDKVPVATPTSKVPSVDSDQPRDGQSPDVPFDGSKPEALGTALPQTEATKSTNSSTATPAADPHKDASPSAQQTFDVYSVLFGSSLGCEGEKQ